jgi:hypothetical protein
MASDEKATAAATARIAPVKGIRIFRGPPVQTLPICPANAHAERYNAYLYACSRRAMSILSICGIAFMSFFDVPRSPSRTICSGRRRKPTLPPTPFFRRCTFCESCTRALRKRSAGQTAELLQGAGDLTQRAQRHRGHKDGEDLDKGAQRVGFVRKKWFWAARRRGVSNFFEKTDKSFSALALKNSGSAGRHTATRFNCERAQWRNFKRLRRSTLRERYIYFTSKVKRGRDVSAYSP